MATKTKERQGDSKRAELITSLREVSANKKPYVRETEQPEAPYAVGGRIRWRRKGTEYAGRVVRVLCNCLIVEDEEQPPLERQIGCWYLDPETKVLDYSEPIEYAE